MPPGGSLHAALRQGGPAWGVAAALLGGPSAAGRPMSLLLHQLRSMTTTNLQEAAEVAKDAAGLQQVQVSDDLMSRLKDKGLLHSAALVEGQWIGPQDGATFKVGPGEGGAGGGDDAAAMGGRRRR